MSSISAISAASASAVNMGRPPGRAAFTAAEGALGMSATEVRSALDGGSNLEDLAAERGVDKDVLIASMAAAITAEQPGISTDRATAIATRIATTTPPARASGSGHAGGPKGAGGPGGPGGPRGAGGPPPPPPGGVEETDETDATTATDDTDDDTATTLLERLAKMLGMTTEELLASLKGGQTLGGIAASRGVDEADLTKAVEASLRQSGSRSIARNATSIAADLVDGSLEPGALLNAQA